MNGPVGLGLMCLFTFCLLFYAKHVAATLYILLGWKEGLRDCGNLCKKDEEDTAYQDGMRAWEQKWQQKWQRRIDSHDRWPNRNG